MRAVIQRVSEARVLVDEEVVAEIGRGFLVFLAVGGDDVEEDAVILAEKIVTLRVFEDDLGKMNHSLKDEGGELLVVSQFTLFGDCRKGRRPSFSHAAEPEKARDLYQAFARKVGELGVSVQTGRFQAAMDVVLTNQGPVTLLLDSRKTF